MADEKGVVATLRDRGRDARRPAAARLGRRLAEVGQSRLDRSLHLPPAACYIHDQR